MFHKDSSATTCPARQILLIGFLLFAFPLCNRLGTAAVAQPAEETAFEISSIEFTGNDEIGSSALAAAIQTRETPGFFNKFLFSTISEKLGRKNEYFDQRVFDEDYGRLVKFYHDRGFFGVRIDTSLAFFVDDRSVEIRFDVQEGYRSVIDTIVYKGIVNVPEFVFDDMKSGENISVGDPFEQELLEAEVDRVLLILKNAGYSNAVYERDSSKAVRYLSTNNMTVVIAFRLGRRYVFGPISISQQIDSLRGEVPRADITDDIILTQMDYKEGDIFSLENWKGSERNLNRVGVFDLARIDIDVPPDEVNSIIVPSHVMVRPKDRHELAPELLLSDQDNAFNIGLGLGYTHRNFLGGARTFSTGLRFRTQTLSAFPRFFGLTTDAVSNIDLTFELVQPSIITNKIKGAWSFSFIVEKQRPYRQGIIRNKFSFTDRFAHFTTGFLEWSLERVRLEVNPDYPDSSSDPDIQEQINLLNKQKDGVQFNSILSFTIQRDKTNDIFSPSSGFVHRATIEEAGLLPLLLKNAQPDLPFTQFYRVILFGRWYTDLSDRRFSIVGLKLEAGLEDKYGETRSNPDRGIPYTHRFFAGGGGGIRGWEHRDLSATGDPQLGGNLVFEGSLELRINVLQELRDDFFDRIWIVPFLDFGNVWREATDLQIQDIALAWGLGFRYDTFFGPFRVDFGFRAYNPREIEGRRWITDRRFFKETLKDGVIHFGIGHAF